MECDVLITKCEVTASLGALFVEGEAVNTLHSNFKTVAIHLGNKVEWRLMTSTLGAFVASSELAAIVRSTVIRHNSVLPLIEPDVHSPTQAYHKLKSRNVTVPAVDVREHARVPQYIKTCA